MQNKGARIGCTVLRQLGFRSQIETPIDNRGKLRVDVSRRSVRGDPVFHSVDSGGLRLVMGWPDAANPRRQFAKPGVVASPGPSTLEGTSRA